MKFRLLFVIMFSGMFALCQGQANTQNSKWEKWNWILGAWKGDGSGTPGQGEGTFAFSFDLNGAVLVRRGHTDFPATQNKPVATHEDLMVVYLDPSSAQAKAVYFDNEGHVINYAMSWLDNSIVFTSEKVGNMPAFRLTYTPLDKDTMDTAFDMSQDGKTFVTYIEGKSRRAK
jgi:hypothetical protein